MVPNGQPEASKSDSRVAERLKLDLSIAYSLEIPRGADEKSSPFRWGTLWDISERGLCFKASDSFFVKRLISLYLKLSHESSGINVLGKVIWTGTEWDGSMRVGVQFIGVLPSDWRKLVAAEEEPDNYVNR